GVRVLLAIPPAGPVAPAASDPGLDPPRRAAATPSRGAVLLAGLERRVCGRPTRGRRNRAERGRLPVHPRPARHGRTHGPARRIRSVRTLAAADAGGRTARPRQPLAIPRHAPVPAGRHPHEGRPDEHGQLIGGAGALLDYTLVGYVGTLPVLLQPGGTLGKYRLRNVG